nr:hypothetical protein [Tanacetum cinerariifolium]
PILPVAPTSPDYVPWPEHPPSPVYMPDPEHPPSHIEIPYVPKPKYPEYMAPSDNEAPLEDHPLPADASPIAVSPDYVRSFSYLVQVIYDVTLSDPYYDATHFGGVTDWHHETRL